MHYCRSISELKDEFVELVCNWKLRVDGEHCRRCRISNLHVVVKVWLNFADLVELRVKLSLLKLWTFVGGVLMLCLSSAIEGLLPLQLFMSSSIFCKNISFLFNSNSKCQPFLINLKKFKKSYLTLIKRNLPTREFL